MPDLQKILERSHAGAREALLRHVTTAAQISADQDDARAAKTVLRALERSGLPPAHIRTLLALALVELANVGVNR